MTALAGVRQRHTACPRRQDGRDADGVFGDCLRAAVATLLEAPYDLVPHFAQYLSWWDEMRRWARARGFDFGALPAVSHTGEPILRGFFTDPDAVPGVIAVGPSPRPGNRGHAVVTDVDLRLLWDPHPSGAGIAHVYEAIVPCPPYWPPPQQLELTARGAR